MQVKKITENELNDLSFDIEEEDISIPQSSSHYVNNEELQAEFLVYHAKKQEWIAAGKEGLPPLSNKIGKAILDIANRRTYSRQFIGYTQSWKEEMVSDAIETCVKYVHNYNPEKYSNPFAYITQLVSHALVQRIKKEQKHLYIKYKSFDNAHGFNGELDEHIDENDIEALNETSDMYNGYLEYIADFEGKHINKKEKPVDKDSGNLLDFVD